MTEDWQTTAWNGISVEIPLSWIVASIGRQYLLFESNGRHVFEIKWSEGKARVSPQRQLARLMKAHPKSVRRSFKTRSVDVLPGLEDRFDGLGFLWENRDLAGEGLILRCRTCGKTTLLQFLKHDDSISEEVEMKILGSFRDHFSGDIVPWRIYDIRAAVPRIFQLDAYRFDVGRFELLFSNPGRSILFQRWGPADVLTADVGLKGFSRRMGLISGSDTDLQWNTPCGIEWSEGAVQSEKNLLGWLKRTFRPEFRCVRVWVEPLCNRILVVRIASSKPVDAAFFAEICAGYESC